MHQNNNFYVRNFFYFPKIPTIGPQMALIVFPSPLGWFSRILFTFFDITRQRGKTVWVDEFFLIVQARQKFWGIAGPKIHCAYGITAKNVILTFLPLQATPLTVQKNFKNLSSKTSTIVVCPIPKHWLKLFFDQKRPKNQYFFSAIFLP